MLLIDNYNNILNRKVSPYEFISIFSNENECLHLYFNIKYSDSGCSKCGRSITKNYVRVGRKDKNGIQKKSFRCKSCHTHIYPLADSIFRKTSVSITNIFALLFLFSHSKGSVSASDATMFLPICYKTAHKYMMLIRSVMLTDLRVKLKGNIEIDEVFMGKGSKVYNWSSISTRKQPIVGMIERETKKARVFLVSNRSSSTLKNLIQNNIEYGSTVFTDSWAGYTGLDKYYNHQIIDHSHREFVKGNVHTNTIENLWGSFKRSIRNSHIKITAKYVQMYMNDLCWRHNYKNETAMQKFDRLLRKSFYTNKLICKVSPQVYNLYEYDTFTKIV